MPTWLIVATALLAGVITGIVLTTLAWAISAGDPEQP